MSLRENTLDTRTDLQRKTAEIMTKIDILDANTILAMRGLIEDMQAAIVRRVAAEMASGNAYREDSWGAYWVPRLIKSIDVAVRAISKQAGEELGKYLLKGWDLGTELVDTTLNAAKGIEILAPVRDPLTLMVLGLNDTIGNAITRIDETTRTAVEKTIKISMALGESPGKLMSKLQIDLKDKPSPFRSVAYRSEIIARTELTNANTLARNVRLQSAVAEFPELLEGPNAMKEVFGAIQMGEWPCKTCEPFDGELFELEQGPMPPLHPNCRCFRAPFFPGISTVRKPPQSTAERRQKASITECYCCG